MTVSFDLGLSFMSIIMLLIVQEDGNYHDAILYCFSFDCISSLDKPVYILIFTINSFDSHL